MNEERVERIAKSLTAARDVEVELYFVGEDEAEEFAAQYRGCQARGKRVTGEIPANKVGEALKSLQDDFDVFPALTNE